MAGTTSTKPSLARDSEAFVIFLALVLFTKEQLERSRCVFLPVVYSTASETKSAPLVELSLLLGSGSELNNIMMILASASQYSESCHNPGHDSDAPT